MKKYILHKIGIVKYWISVIKILYKYRRYIKIVPTYDFYKDEHEIARKSKIDKKISEAKKKDYMVWTGVLGDVPITVKPLSEVADKDMIVSDTELHVQKHKQEYENNVLEKIAALTPPKRIIKSGE